MIERNGLSSVAVRQQEEERKRNWRAKRKKTKRTKEGLKAI